MRQGLARDAPAEDAEGTAAHRTYGMDTTAPHGPNQDLRLVGRPQARRDAPRLRGKGLDRAPPA